MKQSYSTGPSRGPRLSKRRAPTMPQESKRTQRPGYSAGGSAARMKYKNGGETQPSYKSGEMPKCMPK